MIFGRTSEEPQIYKYLYVMPKITEMFCNMKLRRFLNSGDTRGADFSGIPRQSERSPGNTKTGSSPFFGVQFMILPSSPPSISDIDDAFEGWNSSIVIAFIIHSIIRVLQVIQFPRCRLFEYENFGGRVGQVIGGVALQKGTTTSTEYWGELTKWRNRSVCSV